MTGRPRGARPARTRRGARCAAIVWAGAAGAASCARTGGAVAVPNTPAGRAFRAWLDAYNAADSARLEAYARRYEPAMSVHAQLVFRSQTGPFDIASVERSDPRHIELVLRTRPDSTVGLAALTMFSTVNVGRAAASDRGAPQARTTFSLVGTGPQPLVPRIGASERAAAVESVAAQVVHTYVVPDVARRVADSLRARQARGAYDDATEVGFAQHLDRELLALGGDPQLGVAYAWRRPLSSPTPVPPAWVHCGLGPARVGADDVGYVALYGFRWPELDCSHRVAGALQAVAGARALIVDLRENADENAVERLDESRARMAYVASYLVAACTHVGDRWDRRTGATEALWTHDALPGPAFGGTKPLVVLTSARTSTAAEELAYALQRLGRATVVGERTAGRAHVTAIGRVGERLLLRVPVARAVDPTTGTTWERVGVVADVDVPAAEALTTAHRLIRERRVRDGRLPPTPSAPRVASASAVRASASPMGRSGPLRGVRFGVDTLVPPAASRGVLSRVAGVVEFAAGRGRFDVTAVSHAPAVVLDGITVGAPRARPGDYYLFDNTGFVLVRPGLRTFSRVAFTRADFTTGALLPGAYLMKRAPDLGTQGRTDPRATGIGGDGARPSQAPVSHAPVTIHWHMQPPDYGPHHDAPLYARGWLDVADAPAVEAGVARWFEVAAALATRWNGALPPGSVEITSVVVLRQPTGDGHMPATGFDEMLAPRRLEEADVDPGRLVLPAGYAETPWPGAARVRGSPAAARTAAARWRTLEDEASQRARAACSQAWLPNPPEGRPGERGTR